jgi:Protein of unknown function (DUF2752)
LHRTWGLAIVPQPLINEVYWDDDEEVLAGEPVLRGWLRSLLVLVALFLIAVFGIAMWLNPYGEDGTARRMETHRQLGLPECTFKEMTGKPCPSCGMTTSFALFIRGDLLNSLRANFVGTMLALFCLLMVPWCVVCAVRGRYWLILSLEWFLPRFIVVFATLLLLRWGAVLLLS